MRFIPVYTGNTGIEEAIKGFRTVYLCIYREHAINALQRQIDSGLSLCIQGTHNTITRNGFCPRFIPVYTGNTREVLPKGIYHWFIPVYTGNTFKGKALGDIEAVYPCVYREHLRERTTTNRRSGLSLCIQGTLYLCSPLG